MLKASENPATLLPGLERPGAATGDWWVAHTKPRNEKSLAWDLTAKDIPYFLPMARRTQVSGGRRRTSMVPLFPSYLFFCGTRETRIEVFNTHRVVQVLPVNQRAAFVKELDAVHAALAANAELNFYPFAVVGRRCRVIRGPMRGIEGTILQSDNITRLVLAVSVLGQGAALEIDVSFLEEAD